MYFPNECIFMLKEKQNIQLEKIQFSKVRNNSVLFLSNAPNSVDNFPLQSSYKYYNISVV